MAERRFHEFNIDDDLIASFEEGVGKIEEALLVWYRSVLEKRRLSRTPEERAGLSLFIAFQMLRTRSQRDQFARVEEQLSAHLSKLGGKLEDLEGYQPLTEDRLKLQHLHFIKDAIGEFANVIAQKDFLLMEAPTGRSFYLSDNPVCLHNSEEPHPFYGNIGLAVRRIEIYLSLSSRLMLALAMDIKPIVMRSPHDHSHPFNDLVGGPQLNFRSTDKGAATALFIGLLSACGPDGSSPAPSPLPTPPATPTPSPTATPAPAPTSTPTPTPEPAYRVVNDFSVDRSFAAGCSILQNDTSSSYEVIEGFPIGPATPMNYTAGTQSWTSVPPGSPLVWGPADTNQLNDPAGNIDFLYRKPSVRPGAMQEFYWELLNRAPRYVGTTQISVDVGANSRRYYLCAFGAATWADDVPLLSSLAGKDFVMRGAVVSPNQSPSFKSSSFSEGLGSLEYDASTGHLYLVFGYRIQLGSGDLIIPPTRVDLAPSGSAGSAAGTVVVPGGTVGGTPRILNARHDFRLTLFGPDGAQYGFLMQTRMDTNGDGSEDTTVVAVGQSSQ